MENAVPTYEELREIRADYLRDVREKLTLLRRQSEHLSEGTAFAESFPYMLYVSHQLKGSGAMFGFERIGSVAAEMSRTLSSFLSLDQAPRPSADDLTRSITQLVDQLDGAVADAEQQLR
jgi:chemotaxis protein histidine kinase CheA